MPLRGAFALIAAVYLCLATTVAAAAVHIIHEHSLLTLRAAVPVAPARYLVLLVLDGGRPDYLDSTSLPHVQALMQHGAVFTDAIDGILESETPSGHTTIATGSTPAHNGILGFDWAQNDNDYSLFSPDVVRAGAMEHIMESTGTPTIAGLYKARYPHAAVVALSGHKYYAADPLGGPAADAIMYYQGDAQGHYVPVAIPGHVPPAGVMTAPDLTLPTTHLQLGQEDTLATNLALSAFRVMHQRITLINYPEFDWPLGHVDGGSAAPALVAALMRNFDTDLGRIEDAYRKAGILNQTLFVITADHGMQSIHRFVPESLISSAVTAAGTTAPAASYSTGAYVWLADPSRAETVAQNILAAKDPGVQSAYYLSTVGGVPHYLEAGGDLAGVDVDAANRYLLATLINGHEPDVVIFCRNGNTFAATTTNWKADHGGAAWQSQHIPLIIAGPNVRTGTLTAPVQLDDVAPTALAAMGVQPTGMEGAVLTDAIEMGTRKSRTARAAEIKTLAPVVQALQQQDHYEGG